MLVGPVFTRELTTTPRSLRLYLARAGYVAALHGLAFTAWLILSQQVHGLGDLARFGSAIFTLIAPLQLAMAMCFSALLTAAAVAQEKDRRTLDLLLMTRLTNAELVLGKLFASMLSVLVLIVAAVPLLLALTLLGGISYPQVARVVGVTLATALAAGSLGSTIALWRERTFQSLALTALLLVLWLISGEVVRAGTLGNTWGSTEVVHWATAISPLRAILAAMQPGESPIAALDWCGGPVNLFILGSTAVGVLLNFWAIARVRIWNPTQEAERPQSANEERTDLPAAASRPPTEHKSRAVWDNPILWRELCTWSYGKKIIVVRIAYLLIFSICAAGLFSQLTGGNDAPIEHGNLIHPAANPLIPLFVLGLVLVNALAVTSLTNERDLQALDLLLVTDLTPKEIIFGKLGGVLFNSKEMILLPLCLILVLWYNYLLTTENLIFLVIAILAMNAFAAMVGIHVGMTYAESRTAVGVSLSTVLFLLLGIAVCMRMMMAFQSSFGYQLQAFLAFMMGGGVALYLALGRRNPSPAIATASFIAPFATFFVITSFLEHNFGAAFLVTVLTYGFATMAMLIPAIDEFDVATGRTTGG
ncbi:MAG: ABC transporter permease [Pirellulales bacterium]|nr:ABC transporter permease [Pirellulales bacterium]